MKFIVYVYSLAGRGKVMESPTLSGGVNPGLYPMSAGEQIRSYSFWLGAEALEGDE